MKGKVYVHLNEGLESVLVTLDLKEMKGLFIHEVTKESLSIDADYLVSPHHKSKLLGLFKLSYFIY